MALLMKPIVLFYHLFATNDWKNILDEQFSALMDSGLLQVAKLHVCISGPDRSDVCENLEKLSSSFSSCEFHCFEENQYEWSTLQFLWNMAKRDDAYYLYFHAKGVTQTGEKRLHVNSWRLYLSYFCVTRWRDCVGFIENGADLAGCQYMVPTQYYPGHYSGNFWWASTAYLQQLPDPALFISERLEAEFWSCRAPHKAASLCSTDLCMYHSTLLPESYQCNTLNPIVYVNKPS